MRKLASIQRIKALSAIPDADSIEKAVVLGWELVVKKGEFQVGDYCVYCEIDCLMPKTETFAFLASRGMRIRTARLRGQISQGICFGLDILPADFEIVEGADCTEVLGITKYEPPIPASLAGVMKGNFPVFIPKTDETRVQVLQGLLDECKGVACYIAEKLDGSSATYYLRDGEFGVCSRNLEICEDEENTYWKVARELDIEAKLRSLGQNIALQGELCGEGIQGNKLKLRGQTVFFFNVFYIDSFKHANYADMLALLNSLNLPVVPILNDNFELINDINALVSLATMRSTKLATAWAEGIVIRPRREITEGRIKFFSFKVINPEFLIKYNE